MVALRNLVLVVIAAVGLAIASLNATTNALRQSDPHAAALLNPLSVEARISVMSRAFSSNRVDPQVAVSEAKRLLDVAPADARAYSLLGEAWLRGGDRAAATQEFQMAAQLAKTEFLMLIRTIELDFENGARIDSIERIEVLLRRWPGRAREAVPLIARIVSASSVRTDVLSLIQKSPDIGRQLIGLLLADPRGPALAYQFAISLQRGRNPLPDKTLERIIQGLYGAGELRAAFTLFQTSLSEPDRKLASYVFDPDFSQQPQNQLFKWQTGTSPGVDMRWTTNGDGGTILFRFLGKPVKSAGLSQLVVLPPGEYELSTQYTTRAVRAPRGLFWSLRCTKGGQEVARLNFDTSTDQDIVRSTSFSIEDDTCPAFKLAVATDLLAESFRYRYEGTLQIESVRIERKMP